MTVTIRLGLSGGILLTVAAVGAWAGSAGKDPFTPQQRQYWAFQPVQRAPVPAVRDAARLRNPIDAFILARL